MVHFEIKSGLRPFRRIGVSGKTLKLAVGYAADHEYRVSVPYDSTAQAQKAVDDWTRWSLQAGYAPTTLPKGYAGSVMTLEGPQGPGRIRVEALPYDVYFDAETLRSMSSVKTGQRVVVQGVHQRPGLNEPFMFGSSWCARRVLPFPQPAWNQFKRHAQMADRQRELLIRMAAADVMGHCQRERPITRDTPCGSLIYAYEKGVHRFIAFIRQKGVGKMALYEPVFNANFTRAAPGVLSCAPVFCQQVPAGVGRELQRVLG